MDIPRRGFMRLALGGVAVPLLSRGALADAYPSRAVRIVVGFGAGGAPDILARLMGQSLSDRLGQPFVVENQPGASSDLATENVVRAPPDGYTLLLVSLANAVNATLDTKLNYNFMRDITPVAGISRDADVMVVNPSFPPKTIPEFISYAKANPGKINMASPGVGTSPHMAGEMFKFMTGTDMTHVAYRSSPAAITDLLGGQVQVYFAPISGSVDYVRAGKLRALGVTTAARASALPDIPIIGDFVPGYEVSAWYGLGAPRDTPAAIVDTLAKSMKAVLNDPAVKGRLVSFGSSAFALGPAELGTFIGAETDRWAKVIRSENIKTD